MKEGRLSFAVATVASPFTSYAGANTLELISPQLELHGKSPQVDLALYVIGGIIGFALPFWLRRKYLNGDFSGPGSDDDYRDRGSNRSGPGAGYGHGS